MTRNELLIREKAVLYAYKNDDFDKAIDYEMELFDRNKEKKIYRFRCPKNREIESIREANIFLCRPRIYEDIGDCEWIDDIEALVKYDVTVRSYDKYKPYEDMFTSELYREISDKELNIEYKEM
jgi:hypothetical protein